MGETMRRSDNIMIIEIDSDKKQQISINNEDEMIR
jgi:hypothetical protein